MTVAAVGARRSHKDDGGLWWLRWFNSHPPKVPISVPQLPFPYSVPFPAFLFGQRQWLKAMIEDGNDGHGYGS
ncbi:hypothetical protein SESBI_21006 [Sesbania bispinosa]|nr:hypothetical protein SESBI_21006 [Sesbania bispinosa]